MAVPVSVRWEQAIRRGAQPVTEVHIHLRGQGIVFDHLIASSGSISLDRENSYRTSGSLVIPDPDLFPTLDNPSVLDPYGAEVFLQTGIVYPEGVNAIAQGVCPCTLAAEGSAELIPIGYLPIESVSGSEASGRISNISFFDRGRRFEEFSYATPVDHGGKLIQTVIEEEVLDGDRYYLDEILWTISFDPEVGNFSLPTGTIVEGSRWELLSQLAEDLGAEIFFDRDGNVTVQPVPGVYAEGAIPEPDWVIDAGENGVLVDAERSVSREGVYNGVLVLGSADEERAQPFSLVTDDDPNSLTYWEGPFGKSILRIESADLTTDAQCEAAARAELKNVTGLQRSLSLDSVGNPAMDPGDIIQVVFPDGSLETHMLDGYSYDLATMAMSITTRSLQYIPPES